MQAMGHDAEKGAMPQNPHRPRLRGGIEGRQTPRVGTDFPVDVHASGSAGVLPARARDLGIGGMCLATASPFQFKSIHRVTLSLPQRRLEVQAEGRWQRSTPGDQVILTGVSFVSPPDDLVEVLWDHVLDGAKELARFLHARSDLAELDIEEAMGLAQVTRFREVARGQTIHREEVMEVGEDSIFLVAQGEVVLEARVRGARNVAFDRLSPGRLFGGSALLLQLPPSETAIAATDCRLLEIDRSAFEYLCSAKPWLAQRLSLAVASAQARRARSVLLRTRDDL
jgi:CRP-like cAMP-binding protein